TCQSNNTATRTWSKIGTCTGGINHDPLTEPTTCTYHALDCIASDWQYSEWSLCSPQGAQTRNATKINSCNGTATQPLLQNCTYTPTCTDSQWDFNIIPEICPSTGTQTKTYFKITNCENGITKTNESITCTYNTPQCVYTYSDWNSCIGGVQTRTVLTGNTETCQGSPQLNQTCETTPICTESNWSFSLSTCTNGKQNKTWKKSSDCVDGITHSTEVLNCTATDEEIPYCSDSDWESRIEPAVCPSTGTQTKYWTRINTNCQAGITNKAQETISCTPQGNLPTCTSFTYSSWSACSSSGNQTRTKLTQTPTNCTGGNPILTQTCTPFHDYVGTQCGENFYQEDGVCCEDNWNEGIDSCDYDVSNILNQVEQTNNYEALELIDNAQNSIDNGEIAKGRAQAQLALLNSKLADNPGLVEAYDNALLALNENDYAKAENLSIEALKTITPAFDLNDKMTQLILVGGILVVLILGMVLFGRKSEPSLERPSKIRHDDFETRQPKRTQVNTKSQPKNKKQLSETEQLLQNLKDEFK
ncbi:MAG: hypothetical protein WC915_05995, partial [archaeon]